MGPLLRRPWLWHLGRRSVALGAGIGVFFGFLIPIAQIAAAATSAMLLRANLPVAVLATLVSNPLTYAPIFLFAYRTGAALLGDPMAPDAADALADALEPSALTRGDWIARIVSVGKPLFAGLAIFAGVGGVLAWTLVYVSWTVAVRMRWRRRRSDASGDAG